MMAARSVSRVRLVLILSGSFLLYLCSWGLAQSFGVMYIALLEEFGGSKAETTWVQSLFSGVLLMTGPVSGGLLKLYGCRKVGIVGTLILAAGLIGSVFTPSLQLLYFTYGIVGGLGGSFLFTTAGVVVLEHFDKRSSLAVGIAGSGASVGTIVIPLLTNNCLEQYGFRGTFLVLAGVSLQCLVAAAVFTQPTITQEDDGTPVEIIRSEISDNHPCGKRLSFLTLPFILFGLSWAVMMLPFLVPFLFIPDATVSRGLSKQEAAFIASAMGVGSAIGRAGFGFLGDVKRLETTIMHIVPITIFGTLNLVFVFVSGFYIFLVIAVFIGMISAVFDGIHPVITLQLVGQKHLSVGLGVLYCIMSLTTVVGTPTAGWITDLTGDYDNCFFYAAGLSYFSAIIAIFIPVLRRHQQTRLSTDDNNQQPASSSTHLGLSNH